MKLKGRIMNNGYVYVYCPTHPYAKKTAPNGYVYEHRLVAEKKLGRYLEPNEIVHHLNEDKTDNRPENIIVITRSEHHKYHTNWRKALEPLYKVNKLFTPELLRELYFVQNLTQSQIGEKYSVSDSLVSQYFKKYGLTARDMKFKKGHNKRSL